MKRPALFALCLLALSSAPVWASPVLHAESVPAPYRLAAASMKYDSMAILPNGKFYATMGGQYIRASLPSLKIDAGYPKPIRGNWGDLPESFNAGFDAMSVLSNGLLYVTKGDKYVKYTDAYGTKLAPGFPKLIKGNWGVLPESFNKGFDAMGVLPNGILYITKGNQYVKYTNSYGDTVAPGYPKAIQGNWGDIPMSFNAGFDSLESFGGKTYVTRNHLFVRYSDPTASKVDPGYPQTL
ncbi:MAG: hypothetical protein ACO1RX_18760 [Candidatus Sericytochromatia bacterium]